MSDSTPGAYPRPTIDAIVDGPDSAAPSVAPPQVPAPPPIPAAPQEQPPGDGSMTMPTHSNLWQNRPIQAAQVPGYSSNGVHETTQQISMPTVSRPPAVSAAPPRQEAVPAPPFPSAPQVQMPNPPAQQTYQYQQPRAVNASVVPSRAAESMSHVAVRAMAKLPPEKGWRRWLMLLTRINLGLSPDETYERELHAKIRKIVTDPHAAAANSTYEVAVMSLKGGVGKTAITVLLGSVLAKVRANPVLAIDANPDSGNLVDRSRKESEHSLAQLVAAGRELNSYNSVRAHTSMNEANLEVLAAQDYVDAKREFSGADWQTTTAIVSPYYPILIADCGTGLFGSAAQAILESVWGLVIVADTSIDGAKKAGETLDWIRAKGHPGLIARAVVVINHTKRGRESADIDEVKAQFAKVVGEDRVFEMPFDPHIDQGTEINLRLVNRTVLRRITEVAARLSDNFDKPRRPDKAVGPYRRPDNVFEPSHR